MLTAQGDTHQIVTKTFGFADDADFQIEKITPVDNILEMSINHEGESWHIPLAMSGTFQALNALTAAIMAHMSGLPLQDSLGGLAYLKPAPGRMQTVTGHPKGAQIVVDFAHTPDALRAALEALRPEVSNKLYVLFGCGGDRDPSKRVMMGKIANDAADVIIVTDDNPRSEDPASIRAAIMAASPKSIEISPRDTAIKTALEQLEAGDVLLIAGKGHETVQLIGDETLPFSDISVASRIIADMPEAQA
jgi:UDP-N-acetylmuramoyl-L-alanyl-D-glutamate--2,6-diaminopimelate ligase